MKKITGAITYCVSYYSEPTEVRVVPNNFFIPAPQVDSEVIHLTIRENPPVKLKNEAFFFKIIKASFMQRRKTLMNGLANSNICTKEKAKEILNKMNLPENTRGETLRMEQFAQISNMLWEE